jgi:hypothetical protein
MCRTIPDLPQPHLSPVLRPPGDKEKLHFKTGDIGAACEKELKNMLSHASNRLITRMQCTRRRRASKSQVRHRVLGAMQAAGTNKSKASVVAPALNDQIPVRVAM